MKNMKWLILVAALAAPLLAGFAQPQEPQEPVTLSPAAAEVVKLAQSGTSDEVLLAYIQNSPSSFSLSADQILYLKDVGLSPQAISSMLNRDTALRNQPPQYSYDQKAYPPTAVAPAEPAAAVAPAPMPTEPAPPVAAPAPVYVSSPPPEVSYFYQDLSPYGTWVDLPGSGWCWQPSVVVVNRGWRPYCDSGHWVWTDAGWFWASDYSWGWAPFHYGRWFMHDRCGWVWAPDRVWGPAWVSWRSSGDVCGWAPLPPRAVFDVRLGWSYNGVHVGLNFDFGLRSDHFTFIGYRDFCARDLGHRRMAPVEVTRVYNRTTVINNYVVNNNTIINQGIKVERVAAASHTEIHRAAIRDLPAGSPRESRLIAEKSGSVVYRSQLATPAKPVHMVAQKLDQRHPDIQHTLAVPVRAEAKPSSAPGRSSTTMSSTTMTSGSRQPDASKATPRPAVGKPAAARPDYSAPKSRQSFPSSTAAPAAARPDYSTPKSRQSFPSSTAAPAAARPDYSAPKSRQSFPSSTAAPAATRAIEQPNPVVRSAPAPRPIPERAAAPAARQTMEAAKPARTVPSYAPPAETPNYPARASQRPSSVASPSSSQGMNSHTYYPKTDRQAANVHMLPSSKSRDDAPSSPGNSSGRSSRRD